MGHNPPKLPPGFAPRTVMDAHRLGQPVILYCLNCATGKTVSSWKVYHRRGDFPFGSIQGGFWCRDCGRSAVVVVLPVFCPTPRDWARRNRAALPSDEEQARHFLLGEHLQIRVDRWNADGGIEQVIGKVADMDTGRALFDFARQRHPGSALTLRDGLVTHDQVGIVPPDSAF